MTETPEFNLVIQQGEAFIKIKADKTVELIFGEDEHTIIRDMSWPDHEVYKAAVQFALMLDTFFKNGDSLDNLIINSPSGNIAAELLGKDLLTISLAGFQYDEEFKNQMKDALADLEKQKLGENKDNVVDATNRFTKEDDDETE